jgi:spermidine/putrescine transport system permease protein
VIENYGGVLLFTLALALVTAIICLIWGFFFAYAVRFRAGRFGDALIVITLLTLFGGYLVKIYAWKSILGSEGIINGGLIWLGLIDTPITFLIYSPVAVVIALANFLLPFVILPVYAALRNVREVTIEAARDLGAGPWTIIRAIVLPQIRPGLVAGFVFAFLMAAGDYVTPMFLGGTSGSMFGQFIAIEFSTRFNWPAGAAMSLSLLLASLAVVGVVSWLIGRLRHVRGV